MIIKVKNNYHGTEAGVKLHWGTNVITPQRAARIRRKLCVGRNCICAENELGMRGPQDSRIAHVGPHESGGVYVCVDDEAETCVDC